MLINSITLDIGLSSMVDIEQANRKATGNYISMLLPYMAISYIGSFL